MRGATLTKVVSNTLPWPFIGRVFSSMPNSGKSGSGFEPALAPNTCSSNSPIQPLLRFKSLGTCIPASAAISPNVNPAKR